MIKSMLVLTAAVLLLLLATSGVRALLFVFGFSVCSSKRSCLLAQSRAAHTRPHKHNTQSQTHKSALPRSTVELGCYYDHP